MSDIQLKSFADTVNTSNDLQTNDFLLSWIDTEGSHMLLNLLLRKEGFGNLDDGRMRTFEGW